MEIEQNVTKQGKQPRLFDIGSKEEQEQIEQFYLQQLESIPEDKYAEGASEKLKHYLENKKIIDTSQYYESKYKPLDNDVSSSDEAYQKLMLQANIQEYGSNFDQSVYDPKQVIQNQEELLDGILKKSVNCKQVFSQLLKTPNQQGAANSALPLTGPQAIAARFSGFSTTLKNYVPTVPQKQ